jgi:hypothetical protein
MRVRTEPPDAWVPAAWIVLQKSRGHHRDRPDREPRQVIDRKELSGYPEARPFLPALWATWQELIPPQMTKQADLRKVIAQGV